MSPIEQFRALRKAESRAGYGQREAEERAIEKLAISLSSAPTLHHLIELAMAYEEPSGVSLSHVNAIVDFLHDPEVAALFQSSYVGEKM